MALFQPALTLITMSHFVETNHDISELEPIKIEGQYPPITRLRATAIPGRRWVRRPTEATPASKSLRTFQINNKQPNGVGSSANRIPVSAVQVL
jgi:hypothetical protein